MSIEIKNRFTGAVLFTSAAETMREAVLAAISAGAYLAGANLADANLAGANLAGAYLAHANLARANLADADLAHANLADADLADADLADARSLPAGVEATDPPEPYDRTRAPDYAARAARFRERHPDVPVVEQLDCKILEAVTTGGGELDMGDWHSCETTHCRAGWAIHLAGKAGYDLEKQVGSPQAGRMIYLASTGRSAYFYGDNATALEDIKRRAAEQQPAGVTA
ncbi:MAG TPA: pentapeptide repeat-containing protein [Polyangiaceae bacterium]